ncbi:MAG: NADH-quinone oxidoreductase subunit L, partial [Ignavibacteria bacterium]
LIGLPHIIGENLIENFLSPGFNFANLILPQHHILASTEILLIITSVFIASLGILLARKVFIRDNKQQFGSGRLFEVIQNKYYVDEIYDSLIVNPTRSLSDSLFNFFDNKIIDGIVNGLGKIFLKLSIWWRKIQTGVIQDYAIISIAGIVAIIIFILLK